MVPKIHARGKSFKGAAAYLLHDKERSKTADRIAWTETRNMATGNPHVAWKVMAATAMDQDRLKEEAGVKKTGRKSADSVLHLSLAWHQKDKASLTREEMMNAVAGALRSISAEDRQALVICHNDEPHPHVHILVNRVSAQDGRMLSSSKERLALSQWAESYEKNRGQIDCPDRVINNDARRRGEYTRGKKNKARNIVERRQAANDNEQAKARQEEERRKEAEFARRSREQRTKDKKSWEQLRQQHKERQAQLRAHAARQIEAAKTDIRTKTKPEWTQLFQDHQAQQAAFLEREKSILGRVSNALRVIDLKAIMRGDISEDGKTRRQALTAAFDAVSKAGVRLEALKRQQEAERKAIERRQKREEQDAARRLRSERDNALQANRVRFEQERNDLKFVQQMDGAKLRASRVTINKGRRRRDEADGLSHSPGTPTPGSSETYADRVRKLAQASRDRRAANRTKDHDRER